MATVDEQLARQVIAAGGRYADDPPVLQVVSYTDMGGKQAWALLYEKDVANDRYAETAYVQDPQIEWAAAVESNGLTLCRSDKTPVKYGDTVELGTPSGDTVEFRIVGVQRNLTSAGIAPLVRAVPVGWDWHDGVRLNLADASHFGLTWERTV